MQGSRRFIRAPASAVALPALLLGALAVLASGASPSSAPAQTAGCPGHTSHLSPKGGPGARFTMLIRVNKPKNVDQYAAMQAVRGQLRARDIFVVNTRYGGSSPEKAEEIVSRLRAAFPCNRIIALNGLGSDPQRPGYAFSLTDSPHLWAVLLDWEHRDWRQARGTNPGLSSWKRRFGRAIRRLRARSGQLAANLKGSHGAARRVGAVPSYYHDWHYGRVARVLDQRSKRFGKRRGGIQAVATQAACTKRRGKMKGMTGIARQLFRQYGKKKRKRRNLAMQVSFSDHGKAKRHLPVRAVNEGRAAKCIRRGLRAGAGAFLLWASPQSVWALSETRRFRKLRHRRG